MSRSTGFTLNGTSPGPVVRAVQGQLVEVRLRNETVGDGVTLHWHGIDVPNAEDGVAGVTQDAVPVGGDLGLWWSINGHLFPDVPVIVVEEGDVVRMRVSNRSGASHPMHLHGHHAVVLSRDGVRATGSPWVVDSLEVADGESYVPAFVADNPGLWMDHCHNLPHAAQGLVTHLRYAGVPRRTRSGGRRTTNWSET